jgi:hypothetical protein
MSDKTAWQAEVRWKPDSVLSSNEEERKER